MDSNTLDREARIEDLRFAYFQGSFAAKHKVLDLIATLGGPAGSEGDDRIQAIYSAIAGMNLTVMANKYQKGLDENLI